MKSNLPLYALSIRDRKKTLEILKSEAYEQERQTAAIIRIVHSIEKGLCLENPRLGFGVQKLNKLFALCDRYAVYGTDSFCLKMARDVIREYIAYHNEKGYTGDDFVSICEKYAAFPCKESGESEIFGGTMQISGTCDMTIDALERFFADRHSIRDFAGTEVSREAILRAIRAAQCAPSACNRQAVRAYVLPSAKVCEFYADDLNGIGGFAESADKFIFITGKVSAYDRGEYNQHIVSASIFATYLIEALFAQGIGSCMVQRPLGYSTKWNTIAEKLDVPMDERLVLMIAIGNLKDEYKVPVSKRFPCEHIVKFVD